ncbi:MAG TPA: hypothetical protein VE987_08235 [Polyangiaceae bacterium]|nr:hypothetical protein [Polyangiaceae bacterium]
MYRLPVDEPRVHVDPGAEQSAAVVHTGRCIAPHAVPVTHDVPMGLALPLAPQQIWPAAQS